MNWEEASRFERPEDSPGLLLWRLSNAWQRAMRRALAPHGLTHVQFVLLASLSWLEAHDAAPVSQRSLADHAETDAMMTSQVVRALEKAGLVRREAHPGDARVLTVRLTEVGATKVGPALVAVETADHAFFTAHRDALTRLASTG